MPLDLSAVSRRLRRAIIADRRLRNILHASAVATDRMLEQKISDAGPNNQRIDPHVLTDVRKRLVKEGVITQIDQGGTPWYHLVNVDAQNLARRLKELVPLHQHTQRSSLTIRIGQSLEIAVYKALLLQKNIHYFGGFKDLDSHDDSSAYSKIEPPSLIDGRSCGKLLLDFVLHLPSATYAGLEIKNTRPWIYPHSDTVKQLLLKCCALDIVPVLISRRIHYSTFSVLNPCGVLIHQAFNQRYPNSAASLAAQVKDKALLGYHDVRVGNDADTRLIRFLHQHLPKLLPDAREKFDRFKDLLAAYADGDHSYQSFAARVKRRVRGEPEDGPVPEPEAVDGQDVEIGDDEGDQYTGGDDSGDDNE